MNCAYNDIYLERVRDILAVMFDYAINTLGFNGNEYFQIFSGSEAARQFECGNPSYVSGISGLELTHVVLDEVGLTKKAASYRSFDRSPEYWCGWAVGYYQWIKNISFSQIRRIIPFDEMLLLYNKYHELDIRHFCDHMDQLAEAIKEGSNLKRLRRLTGYTQRLVSIQSGVPLRTIQQYEQRQKNINKAQAEAVINLARVLGCEPEDLLEE